MRVERCTCERPSPHLIALGPLGSRSYLPPPLSDRLDRSGPSVSKADAQCVDRTECPPGFVSEVTSYCPSARPFIKGGLRGKMASLTFVHGCLPIACRWGTLALGLRHHRIKNDGDKNNCR